MRKTLIAILLLINGFLIAQERVNAEKPIIGSEKLGSLTSATGWVFNNEKEWVSRPNRIPAILDARYSAVLDTFQFKRGIDNFEYYEFRTMKYKGGDYIILIKKFLDGNYKYPAIKQDWYDYPNFYYYVFKASNLLAASLFEEGKPTLMKIPIVCSGETYNALNESALPLIASAIAQEEVFQEGYAPPKKPYKDDYLAIYASIFKEKNIAQFQIFYYSIPRSKGKHERTSVHGIAGSDLLYHGDRNDEIYDGPELFKNFYFETSYGTFMDFFPKK